MNKSGSCSRVAAAICLTFWMAATPVLGAAVISDEVRQSVASDGQARVLIELEFPVQRERALSRAQVLAQREAIARQQGQLRRSLKAVGAPADKSFRTVPGMALTVNEQVLDALERSPLVKRVYPDRLSEPSLDDSTQVIQADQMWANTPAFDGTGYAVAVLDTGVDKNHPFFAEGGGTAVVAEFCSSTNFDGGEWTSSSFCPGGAASSTASDSGLNCDGSLGGCDHGTHVAGIVAGRPTTSGFGNVAGVAPGASLIAMQVFSRFDNYCGTAPCVLAYGSDQVAALEHVLSLDESQGGPLKVAAANMSLGGGQYFSHCDGTDPLFEAALDNLRDNDIAVAIATGNSYYDDSISSPACHAAAIAVGSTTKSDRISGFSNIADGLVDVYAPGSSIASSVLGDSFSAFNGTSMATPHVAGAWALMRQALDGAGSTDVSVIEELLESTGTPINLRDNGSDAGFSVPRINIFDAAFPPATYMVTASAATGGSIDPAGAVAVVENNTVTFTVTPQAGYEVGAVDTDCPNPQLLGDQYSVGPIAGDCFVQANFAEVAMNLSETGEGEVLLFPFYTAEAGAQTEFYVANSTDHVKAVRISVREGMRGAETLAWNVYLGPQDSFRGFIADDEGGGAAIYAHSQWTDDTTCTVPSFGPFPQPFAKNLFTEDSFDGVERTLAGYIEVVEMGQWDPTVGKGLAAANQDCGDLVDAWSTIEGNDGAWLADPTDEALPWQGGGLSGNTAVQRWREDLLEVETLLAYDAIAISGFARNKLPAEYHVSPGSDGSGDYPAPSLRAGALTFEQSINGVIREQTADTGLEAISALLTTAQIEVGPGIAEGAPESWLITMPTKYHHSSDPADLGPFSQVWDSATSTACEHIELGQQNGDLPLLNTWDGTACAAVNVLERAAAGSELIPAPNWLTGPLTSIEGQTADAARLARSGPNVAVDDRRITVTMPDNNAIEKIGLPIIAIPVFRDLANDVSVVGEFEEKKEHIAAGLELVVGSTDWTKALATVPFTTVNSTGFDVDLYTLSCQAEGSGDRRTSYGEGPDFSSLSIGLDPHVTHECSLTARTAIGESEPVSFTLTYTGAFYKPTNNTSSQGGSIITFDAFFSSFIGDEAEIADEGYLYALVYLYEGMLVDRVDGTCIAENYGNVIGDGSLLYVIGPIESDCSFEFVFARDPTVQLAPTLNSLTAGNGSLTAAFTPNSGGAEADAYTLSCSPTDSLRQASPQINGFNPQFEMQSRQRSVTSTLMSPAEIQAGGHRCGFEAAEQQARALGRIASAPLNQADCSSSNTTILGQYNPLAEGVYTIPIVWHVIYNSSGVGYVNQSDIEAQMAVLNEDFAAQFETSLRFTLDSINYVQSDAWFGASEDDWKPELVQQPDKYMNVYTNDIGALGYAYFPDGSAGQWWDGVVMDYAYVGGRNLPNAYPYDLGRTLVHEIGHYLGLYHTFQADDGQCANTYQSGDYIQDTWPHYSPDYGVDGANVCGGVSPIENFMNYSDDIAMDEFTAEQSNRMICSLKNYRPQLAVPGSSVEGTSSPLTLSGLTNGTSYTCSVTASSAGGTSAPSSSLTATPAAPTLPPTPSIARTEPGDGEILISIGGGNGGSPILQWQASCTDGVNTFTGDSFAGPSVTVSGLTNGTRYQCRARVRNALGWSVNWSAYTEPSVPEELTQGLPVWLLYVAVAGNNDGSGDGGGDGGGAYCSSPAETNVDCVAIRNLDTWWQGGAQQVFTIQPETILSVPFTTRSSASDAARLLHVTNEPPLSGYAWELWISTVPAGNEIDMNCRGSYSQARSSLFTVQQSEYVGPYCNLGTEAGTFYVNYRVYDGINGYWGQPYSFDTQRQPN